MTDYERQMDNECFINVYKSINGFKPRGHEFFDATEERRAEIWQMIDEENDRHNAEVEDADKAAVIAFEKLVQKTIDLGAACRRVAIDWILDGNLDEYDKMYVEGDPSYFNFQMSLPYGYDWRNGNFQTGVYNPFTGKVTE